MDNQFLRHLQSLTPEGKAAEKKLFIPADQFKAKEPEKIDMGDEVEVEELDEAILKGDSARRSILLRKNKEAKQQAAKFQDTVKWAGSPQTAALYTKPPEPSPTARLRTRKTDKRGVEVGGKKDFSAAEKSAKAGQQNAEEIMDVLHRKPEGTKIKVFGKGPRGTDKTVHVHRKTELGKHKFYHSPSGKEVELVKGGVGLRILDARTKRVILDRGNDAIWESTMNEAAPDVGQNLKGMPRRSARKLAYALKGSGTGKIDNNKYRVASARQTRKMISNAKRWGKKLDAALKDFSERTGIPLNESSLSMRQGIRYSNKPELKNRADAALLRAISKINREAGGTGRITVPPGQYEFSDDEYGVMVGHAEKGRVGSNRRNVVRAARMRGATGRPEMNEQRKQRITKASHKRHVKRAIEKADPRDRNKLRGFADAAERRAKMMGSSALASATRIWDMTKGGVGGRIPPTRTVGPGNVARNYYRNLRSSVTEGTEEMSESRRTNIIQKKYKTGKKIAKRVLRKLGQALMTPQDAIDIMLTGRNF